MSIALTLLLIAAAFPLHAQTSAMPAKKPATEASPTAPKKSTATPARKKAPGVSFTEASEKQLAQLSRALRDNSNAETYAAFSAFAKKNAKSELGARAALALGYYDLSRDKPQLALGWLRKAVDDKLLREYVQYWQAQASLSLGQREEGLEQLQSFRRDFPDSVMTEQAAASLAQTALAIGKGEDAVAALEAYPNTALRPALLLLRAQAREKLAQAKGEKPLSAAADYLDLYYRFPLNDEAKAGGRKFRRFSSHWARRFPARRCKRRSRARRPFSSQSVGATRGPNMQLCYRSCLVPAMNARSCALRNATCNRAARWNCSAQFR